MKPIHAGLDEFDLQAMREGDARRRSFRSTGQRKSRRKARVAGGEKNRNRRKRLVEC